MKNSNTFAILSALLLVSSMSYAQTCNPSLTRTAPDSRYQEVEGSDGAEILDLHTQLIWQRCSVGQQWNGVACTGTASRYKWIDALAQAKAIGDDYRLPNIKELQSLVEEACDIKINQSFFPQTPDRYFWSSSPVANTGNNAWVLYGSISDSWQPWGKGEPYHVRAVRTVQRP